MNKKFQLPESWNLNKRIQEMKTDSFEKYVDQSPNYINRYKSIQTRKDNIVRVLTFPEVSPNGKVEMIKEFDYTHNLVTNDGEIYYAIKGAGETPAANEDFETGFFDMGTTAYGEAESDTYNEYDVAGSSSISGSIQSFTATYPKTNDTGDPDNTGDAIDAVSYAVNYNAASFNDTDIEQGAIHDNGTPATTTKLLSVFSFTSFAKTAADTLKVFVNHAFENQ